jgi:tetratricopeptide (TPR) repeat protein
VLRHAPVAARRAAAVGSHREAIGHFKVVLEHADRFPPDERAALLEELSIECYLTGRSTEAVAARREAVALRKTLGDPEALGAGLRWLSRMHWWDGDRPAAEAAAERAIEVLEALGPSRELGMAYSNRSQLDMLAHRHASAVEWAHRAIAMAERFDDPAVASLDEAGAAALRAEMLDIARRFDVSDDDTLVLRMDYLEVVVHKDEA